MPLDKAAGSPSCKRTGVHSLTFGIPVLLHDLHTLDPIFLSVKGMLPPKVRINYKEGRETLRQIAPGRAIDP